MSRISYQGHVYEFKTSTPHDGVIAIDTVTDVADDAQVLIQEHPEIRSFTLVCPINRFDSMGRIEKVMRTLKKAVGIPIGWADKSSFNHFMKSIKRENDQQLLSLIENALRSAAAKSQAGG